jgi:ferredoxin
MIVAEQKPLAEIRQMTANYHRVLLVGCGTCVTVCFAGGAKEVAILGSSLRIAAKIDNQNLDIVEDTVLRQCEPEFVEQLRDKVNQCDAVLSIACGVGIQTLAEVYPKTIILPGLNTVFYGRVREPGVWTESCLGCGNCILHLTGGICPIARCAKSLLNGPCGGSVGGKCEVSPDVPCAWQQIYDRLAALGQLDSLLEIKPAKDWSTAHDGGPRTIVREDLKV